MTVNSTSITSGPYVGNNVAFTFSYTFRVANQAQLSVYETTDLGVETLLVVDTDYTVAGVGDDAGGLLTRLAGPLPTDYTWFIRSNYQATQATAFQSQGAYFPDLHEDVSDKLTFLIQQLTDRASRSPHLSDTYPGALDLTLEDPIDGNLLRWKSDLSGLENVIVQQLGTIVDAADLPYTNTISGLTAADVQAAIDEIDAVVDTIAPTYPTVAAMVADTSGVLVVGINAKTQGYYAAGDGGGADYLVAASAAVDGLFDHTLANSNIALLQHDGRVNALQIGAKGDATTDDSPVARAAVANAPIQVYWPAKTYSMGATITVAAGDEGVLFYGDVPGTLSTAIGTAVFTLDFDGVMFTADGTGTSIKLGLVIKNMKFDGGAVGGRIVGTWLQLDNAARDVYLEGIYVVNFFDYGINAISGQIEMIGGVLFNNGYNIYGIGLSDSKIIGGETGSGAGGGATWVNDNIYILGSSGNTHFTNHRPNFSAGVGVKIGGDATRITFSGGLCDQNLLGGFSLEDRCTAIKIIGMDIFDNGTTSVNQAGIIINTSQDAAGFVSDAGIQIIGNSVFDRAKGAAGEKQDKGISINSGGSVTNLTIVGNGLLGCTIPINTTAIAVIKPGVSINSNVGYVTQVKGESATFLTDSTGVKTLTIDVAAAGLTGSLHAGAIVHLTLSTPSVVTFDAIIMPISFQSGTTFDIKINVTTASGTVGSTAKVLWSVFNGNE